MRAKIPADSGVLPGEFLRIRFMTAVDRGAWRVPQRCVKQLPDGTYAVFVMQDGKAIQKQLKSACGRHRLDCDQRGLPTAI